MKTASKEAVCSGARSGAPPQAIRSSCARCRREVARARALAVQLDLQAQVVDRVGVAQRVFVGDGLASYRSNSAWSKVCMPSSRERFMISLISATSPLKIRSEISGVLSMISTAATRPLPSWRGSRRCETSAFRFSDRSISSCARRSSGKKLMIRSSAWLALLACSVARHRWPVSANATACSIVSRSRISPIRITSGAWRSVFFSAVLPAVGVDADLALRDDAVLVRVHELDRVLDRDDVAVASSRCGSRPSPPARCSCPSRWRRR